jgi:hypothetical protein
MKVNIGPYKHWFGPYQLAEKLCFWVKEVPGEYGIKSKPEWVHNFGEWLAHGNVEPEQEVGTIRSWDRDRPTTWLYKFLLWVDSKRKRKIKVHIDKWDTWGMDHTLAHIVLPMLKQLRDTKHGCPYVDDEDVPENLRVTTRNDWDDQLDLFDHEVVADNHTDLIEQRWDYVINEMIFAFETHVDDGRWEDQFEEGEYDIQWEQLEGGMSKMIYGPNHTMKYDEEGRERFSKRIANGFRLFGKYYQNLWD